MITADQLVIHAVGDYVLQSDWMANTKTTKSVAALAHVVTYTAPFLLLTQSWMALSFILVTHFVIDRWRLARYVCWVKNFLAPAKTIARSSINPYTTEEGLTTFKDGRGLATEVGQVIKNAGEYLLVVSLPTESNPQLVARPFKKWYYPWSECSATGYHKDRPAWMSVWLMIITDNVFHVICNGFAITYLG